MMGAMELPTVGWIGAIGISMILIVWFVFVKTASNPLLVLAFAEFSANWAIPILSIAYLVSPLGADLRDNTGVHLKLAKFRGYTTSTLAGSPPSLGPELVASGSAAGGADQDRELGEPGGRTSDFEGADKRTPGDDVPALEDHIDARSASDGDGGALSPPPSATHIPHATETTESLLLEGFKIMFMDVAVQCCISLGIYLALAKDAAEAYQLTALQSALPTYGMGTFGLGLAEPCARIRCFTLTLVFICPIRSLRRWHGRCVNCSGSILRLFVSRRDAYLTIAFCMRSSDEARGAAAPCRRAR
jgi:hypothetical protein